MRKQRLEALIHRLARNTKPITTLRNDLQHSSEPRDSILLEVMHRYYFERMPMKDLAAHLLMNDRTLYRRRNELVKRVIDITEREVSQT